MEFGKALAESAISTVSSTTVQSAVNGDSFSKAIKNQGLNILIGAVGNIGAKQIGMNYKTSTQTGMDKAIQLTSHAVLGCAMSAAGGGDCASGAMSGITGELAGMALYDSVYGSNPALTKDQAAQLAGAAGGLSAIFTGNAIGLSDSEVADNIFSGQRIGDNAARNNALKIWVQEVAAGNYHTSIKIEPENQEKYANDSRFDQVDPKTGKRYATIGAGPDSSTNIFGNLIAGYDPVKGVDGINRERDIDTSNKVWQSNNLVKPEVEDSYISSLFDKNKNYNNSLDYELFPSKNSEGYNSNSYVSGILSAAGITPPVMPIKTINYEWKDWEYPETSPVINVQYTLPKFPTPGYNKPVPIKYFEESK